MAAPGRARAVSKVEPMSVGLTPEHLELAAAVRGWSQRHCPPAAARAAGADPDGGAVRYRAELAPALAGQGLFGLHLAEAAGGQGYGMPELAVALEELGRALLPGGHLPTVLASAVLAEAKSACGSPLAGLADGSLAGTVALGGRLAGEPGPGGDLIVTGEISPVLAGPLADLVIAPVRLDGQTIWVALDAAGAGVEVSPLDSLDLTRPLAAMRADHARVPAARVLPDLDHPAVSSLAAITFGAEACGIAGWAVQTAAEYAKLRHQFGRPIGQFQAVKHRCARMLAATELARAAVWDAARAPSGPSRELAAAIAAVVAIDAAVDVVHDCIQTLGGIGYTWEHDAHLYYRRALSLRALLGPSAAWRERVARLALAGRAGPATADPPGDDSGFREEVRADLARIAGLSGRERVEALAAGGWVMPHLPRPWGRAASPLQQLVIDSEMRAAGLRPPPLAIGAWVVPALIKHGTAEQQQRFLPGTLRGDYLWCQLFSEPGAGSDLAGLTTRAERTEGGWRISGQKIWTSLAREAAWGICLARTDPAAPRHEGISCFLVDMSSPGVRVRPLRDISGDAPFHQVFLDDVLVPDDCLVGKAGDGWAIARTTLANERVSLSASWTFGSGVPELLEVARAAEAPPMADVGRLVAEGRAIEVLGLRATIKRVSGTDPGATGSVRKLLSTRHAQQVAEACLAMCGHSGALGGHGSPGGRDKAPDGAWWARQVLLTRALTIGGGTTDIQLNIIGERMLGLPRDLGPPE